VYNGPKTDNWYVRSGIFQAYSLAKAGIGAYVFDFWNFENDMVYTYGFAGAGAIKPQLKYAGIYGNFSGSDVSDWLSLSPNMAFSPEELDGALGRIEKIGLSVMGIGYTSFNITAYRGLNTTYFSGAKVDVKNTGFFKFPAVILAGYWELLDANKQTQKQTQDWDKIVNG
jgi:hypothetical protein